MLWDFFSLFPAYAGVIPVRVYVTQTGAGLFPAYAGVILVPMISMTLGRTFPRIRGGDPRSRVCHLNRDCFSPHTRG